MDIVQSTAAYEAWLSRQLPLIPADLDRKHQRMAESPFPFLRATFYRWAQLWRDTASDLANAQGVLGVGDLHVENFGTWRDGEGRLIWGVNDFDEAALMPYTNDLVRLAVSAGFAINENELYTNLKSASEAILEGYRQTLEQAGAPFVLAENHVWLRAWAFMELRDPVAFWQKFDQLKTVKNDIPETVRQTLEQALPERGIDYRIVHRVSGLGSLGRRRFVALGNWRGGRIAREAKELTTSAWHWENSAMRHEPIAYQAAISRAVRVPDPFVSVKAGWLLRRLAPDCSRIELGTLPKAKNELKLLTAMGSETANVHLGTEGARAAILRDLKKRGSEWLFPAAKRMASMLLADWEGWTEAFRI